MKPGATGASHAERPRGEDVPDSTPPSDDRAFRLDGQIAVVTGSSSGIGRAIALEFAAAGSSVVVHARQSRDACHDVRDAVRRIGGRSEAIFADLADSRERQRFADLAQTALGPVDVWINNAGADILTKGRDEAPFEEKLDRLLDVDVRATMLLSRTVGRSMLERGRGVILNLGWDQAASGMEGDSGELFGAVKSAVMGFSKSLALSLAPAVRVHCIAPGWIRTAWGTTAPPEWHDRVLRETPLGRWGTPEDIARLARFLASPAADYLTGQVVFANGGAIRV